jgi:hypothetical protein
MSGGETPMHALAGAGGPIAPPREALQALAAENAVLAARLRSAQIPQHVGMAAACRALAVELPRALLAEVDADLTSGALAQRWNAALAAAAKSAAGSDLDPALIAIAALLREQGRSATRHLTVRGNEWAADAYRLEGQAGALEAQVERLRRAVGPVDAPATDAAAATEG